VNCSALCHAVALMFLIASLLPEATNIFAETPAGIKTPVVADTPATADTSAELPVWPGKTLITAASLEGLFTLSEEADDTVTGYGARASFSCIGAFARQLALDASISYRWLEGPDGPVPFPGFSASGGWLLTFFNTFSLTPFGGLSVEFRSEDFSPDTVTALTGGMRLALLLSGRDYLTLTPSVSFPLSGNASPAVSLALGLRSERAWLRPVPDKPPTIRAKPALFSPDGDGEDDETVLVLSCADRSLVSQWTVTIYGGKDTVLVRHEGTGRPPRSIIWKGEPDPEAIEPGFGYRVIFETVDVLGRNARGETTVTCDILVIKDGNRYRVRVPNIIFPSDSWELSPRESRRLLEENRLVLERVATLFSRFPSYSLTVEGYAHAVHRNNPVRYAEEQQKELLPLSRKRAETVRDALVMLGIDDARINTKAYGGERPKTTANDTEEAWKNRRVEFILER